MFSLIILVVGFVSMYWDYATFFQLSNDMSMTVASVIFAIVLVSGMAYWRFTDNHVERAFIMIGCTLPLYPLSGVLQVAVYNVVVNILDTINKIGFIYNLL